MPAPTAPLLNLAISGGRWSAAAAAERAERDARDAAIVAARKAGAGVREIGRIVPMDPTQVTRVLRRAGL